MVPMERIAKPTVYVDTTIPSYYFETRDDPIVRAHQLITVQWWEACRDRLEFYTSQVTLVELSSLAYPAEKRAKTLGFMTDIPVLDVTDEIESIARRYVEQMLMPRKNLRDALHLALASFYELAYLATWNCAHLANVRKRHQIELLNGLLGLRTPWVVTPEELLVLEGGPQ